jgi:hypothetical protein
LYSHSNNNPNQQQAIIIMPMPRRYLPTIFLRITDNHRLKSYEQDDASMTSTMTVERGSSSTNQAVSTTDDDASSSRRSVSFCMAKNESFSNNAICKEDLRVLWYESSDFKHFRSYAAHVAKEIIKAEARSKGPFSYERVMTHTYVCCCKATSEQGNVLTADEFDLLVRWAKVATSRLGLEKWSIRSMAHDRSYRRSLMVDMVLEAQNNYLDDFVRMDAYVADSCATISRPMRLFSRILAEAQAVATRNDIS